MPPRKPDAVPDIVNPSAARSRCTSEGGRQAPLAVVRTARSRDPQPQLRNGQTEGEEEGLQGDQLVQAERANCNVGPPFPHL